MKNDLRVLLACALTLPCFAQAAPKPNVVIFLADDSGWGDYSFNGNTNLATPTEMRDFIEQYVGPMVLKPDGEIVRKDAEVPAGNDTAPAEAGAGGEQNLTGPETEPLHAGRMKRSIVCT